MFRTVSQIRAHRGRCFIVTNTPASTNDAGAAMRMEHIRVEKLLPQGGRFLGVEVARP